MALPTFRILLSMFAADLDVEYIHGDVTAAFVSSKMKRDVYVYLPSHLCPKGEERVVYKLEKALYGGVDAGRCFYDDWVNFHVNVLDFQVIHQDKCYLFKIEGDEFIRMVFHADDTCYARKGDTMWNEYKKVIAKRFKIRFEPLQHFLGFKITRDPKTGVLPYV